MKRIIFALATFFACFTMSFAQNTLVATLQHEGNFTHYYGSNALTSAYNAAVTGDVVTLSPGTFSSPGTINKGITLRGTGVEATSRSFISGSVYFKSTDSILVTVVEGIVFDDRTCVYNDASGTGQGTIKFIKNYFESGMYVSESSTYSTKKGPVVRLYNCGIYANVLNFSKNSHPDFLFYNCFVDAPECNDGFSQTTTTFVNCIIRCRNSYIQNAKYLNFYNCIFNFTTALSTRIPNTNTCFNCLSINNNSLFSSLLAGGNNKYASNVADVFKTYSSTHDYGETFELTDTAQTAYIGTDGTQIGMQGGNYPYNTKVQYPIITQFSSDVQTSKEGILNINVEVDGNQ